MPEPPLVLDNPFWEFSCTVYAAPGVRETCLALQDRFALDVNLALLCVWVGAERGRAMTGDDIAAARAAIGDWQSDVVRPLREVRQRVKQLPLLAEPAVAAFRQCVARIELEAERLQQAILFRWADLRWPGPSSPSSGLALSNLQVLLAPQQDRGAAGIAPAIAMLAQAAERHATLSGR